VLSVAIRGRGDALSNLLSKRDQRPHANRNAIGHSFCVLAKQASSGFYQHDDQHCQTNHRDRENQIEKQADWELCCDRCIELVVILVLDIFGK
jgi:hypothetical protein